MRKRLYNLEIIRAQYADYAPQSKYNIIKDIDLIRECKAINKVLWDMEHKSNIGNIQSCLRKQRETYSTTIKCVRERYKRNSTIAYYVVTRSLHRGFDSGMRGTANTLKGALEDCKQRLRNYRVDQKSIQPRTRGHRLCPWLLIGGVHANAEKGELVPRRNDIFKALKVRQSKMLYEAKAPSAKDKDLWIAVEIECLVPHGAMSDLTIDLAQFKKYIHLKGDGSISGDGEPLEIAICCTRQTLNDIMPNISQVLDAHDVFVNKSCGLHVHFDCRHITQDMYNTIGRRVWLSRMMLASFMPNSRRNNRYCRLQGRYDNGDRYQAVNTTAWHKYRTLEIRLHSSTISSTKILKWIQLLEKVMNTTELDIREKGLYATAFDHNMKYFKISDEDKAYWKDRFTKFNGEGTQLIEEAA